MLSQMGVLSMALKLSKASAKIVPPVFASDVRLASIGTTIWSTLMN